MQDTLGRRILIENISSYLQYRDAEIPEFEFLAELASRSGCGILCDVNNLYVNAVNHGSDPYAALRALPSHSVGEIHLAGHLRTADCLIDDHGSRVINPVWGLYEFACRQYGSVPALIEWDTNIPALGVLLDEVRKARAVAERAHV